MRTICIVKSGLIIVVGLAITLQGSEFLSPELTAIPGATAQRIITTSTNFLTACSVTNTVPTNANVFVIASFSVIGGGGQTRDVLWNLSYGGQESVTMRRFLSGSGDTGNASGVHLFTNVPPGIRTFDLKYASSVDSRSVTLFGVNLCAIPLTTDKGSILASSMASLTTTSSVSSTTFTDIGLLVTVAVNRVSMSNALFMAASINSVSGGTAVYGMWQFETRKTGESWTSTGIQTRRYFSGANDHGAVSLFGLARMRSE
jgi:hypothetical protein